MTGVIAQGFHKRNRTKESCFTKKSSALVVIVLTLTAFVPYIRAIFNGVIRPHVFSWVIGGCDYFSDISGAEAEDKGGVGAWPIGVSRYHDFHCLPYYIKRADVIITKTDWLFFVAALSSLPLWYLTSDPLWAVVLLTVVDVFGFGPTVRKAIIFRIRNPCCFFGLFTVRNLLVMMALENHSFTLLLFPAVIVVVCVLLMMMIAYRRRVFASKASIDNGFLAGEQGFPEYIAYPVYRSIISLIVQTNCYQCIAQ